MGETTQHEWPVAGEAAGLTAWDAAAALKSQLRSAGVLHGVTEHGTLALFLAEERAPTPEQVADCLQSAWQQTDMVRLRLIRGAVAFRQLTFAS